MRTSVSCPTATAPAPALQAVSTPYVPAFVRVVPPLTSPQKDVPQFIVFTADDAVETYTIDAVNQFLQHRQNPNGCQPKMTYFTSLNYTNFGLVTGEPRSSIASLAASHPNA